MAWDLMLRYRSLLPSLVVRVYSILRSCYDFHSPLTWLLLYYPLFYLAKVAKRLPELSPGRQYGIWSSGKPTSSRGQGLWWLNSVASLKSTTLSLVILGPLLYVLLLKYCFLETDFCKRSQPTHTQLDKPNRTEEDNTYEFVDKVPDRLLKTQVEIGLSRDEVIARRKTYGLNELRNERNWLLAAALLAVVFGDWWDLLVICPLLALNIRGQVQSIRGRDEVAQDLTGDIEMTATVRREGTITEINAKELVPGDIVHVSQGTCMQAECRIVASESALYMNQSAITGESDPVEKQHGDTCYATTGVARGDAVLIVIGTGYQTFIGRTLSLIGDPVPTGQSPFKTTTPRHVREYHGFMRGIGTSICAVNLSPIAVSLIFSSRTRFAQQIQELAMGLAIFIVPASLNTIIDAFRSRGMARLQNDGGLVRGGLMGGESLAGIDILCVDKTGTITENRLSLLEPYCISGDTENLMLTAGLTFPPDKQTLDPIDKTLAEALEQYPQAKSNLDRYKVIEMQPFDFEKKRTQSLVESPLGERMLCVKGGPKSILDLYLQDYPDSQDIAEQYRTAVTDLAGHGARSLAIARKRGTEKWELLGLLPLVDPPRPDVASTLRIATALGISIKMYTGDAADITKHFIQSVGMGAEVLDIESIDVDGELPSSELVARIEKANAYAVVEPTHKERIVEVLQSCGHVVAATGDGSNDTATLRRADCGIAVEGATEIAQSASDIVFNQDPGLAPMIRAIQTSREIFQQVNSYIAYRTTISLHMLFVMIWYFVAYNRILDVRLLILNTHLSDMVGLALNSEDANIPLSKKPLRWSSRRLLADVIPLVIILGAGSWLSMLATPDQAASTQSQVLFLHIVLSDHWVSLLTRTDGRFWAYATRNWQVMRTVFCAGLVATLLCLVGLVGEESRLSVLAASWAWLVSFGTVCVAACLQYMVSDGGMLKRPA